MATDADTAARLAALGYVSSAGGTRKGGFTDKDDPKNLVELNEAFNAALRAQNEGRPDAALAGLRSILSARPDFIAAWTSAATILIGAGRPDQALDLLQGSPSDVKSVPVVRWRFGLALAATGKLAEAAAILESAVEDDRNADIMNSLGVVYAELGRFDDGRRILQRALESNPNGAGTWNNLGVLELNAKNRPAAADAFRHAVRSDPNYADAWRGLGAAVVTTNPAEAISAWEKTIALQPRDYDTLFNLGVTLAGVRPGDALPVLRRFIAEAPRERYGRDIARVQVMIGTWRRPGNRSPE